MNLCGGCSTRGIVRFVRILGLLGAKSRLWVKRINDFCFWRGFRWGRIVRIGAFLSVLGGFVHSFT